MSVAHANDAANEQNKQNEQNEQTECIHECGWHVD